MATRRPIAWEKTDSDKASCYSSREEGDAMLVWATWRSTSQSQGRGGEGTDAGAFAVVSLGRNKQDRASQLRTGWFESFQGSAAGGLSLVLWYLALGWIKEGGL